MKNDLGTILVTEHKKKLMKSRVKSTLLITNLIVWSFFAYQYSTCYQAIQEQEMRIISKVVRTVHASTGAETSPTSAEPTEMKAWVKWRISQTNISWKDYSCMVEHESNWNQYAINKNTNGTYDTGYLQINQVHKLPRECSFNYKCATEWAIEKIKKQGFNPWYGWRNNCQ